MQFLLKITVPNEPFNTYAKDGSIGAKMGQILAEVKPLAAYFSETNGKRTAYLIVNLTEASEIPRVGEPWFLVFDAAVEFHPVMSGEDLGKAGLEALGKKWS